MKGSGLAQALGDLEAVLKEEASAKASEDLTGRKEAAVARLQALLQSGESLDGDLDGIAQQLRELLLANRFSLKWNGLRVRLARLSQPKPSVEAPRPRLDLVH